MLLEIDSTQLHDAWRRSWGRTERGSGSDYKRSIRAERLPGWDFPALHTEALEPGQHTISVLGSNRRGGTNVKQVSIVVPK